MAESEDLFGTQEYENNFAENGCRDTENKNEEGAEQMETEAVISEKSTHKKLTELPLTRIKTIMKMDPDVHIASQEAVYLVAKATELFLDSIAKETYKHTAKAKRKTVQRRDLDAAIENLDSLCFLEGALD